MDDRDWRSGFGNLQINGQDLGVLDELVGRTDAPLRVTDDERRGFSRLRDFLGKYIGCDYEFVQGSRMNAEADE